MHDPISHQSTEFIYVPKTALLANISNGETIIRPEICAAPADQCFEVWNLSTKTTSQPQQYTSFHNSAGRGGDKHFSAILVHLAFGNVILMTKQWAEDGAVLVRPDDNTSSQHASCTAPGTDQHHSLALGERSMSRLPPLYGRNMLC